MSPEMRTAPSLDAVLAAGPPLMDPKDISGGIVPSFEDTFGEVPAPSAAVDALRSVTKLPTSNVDVPTSKWARGKEKFGRTVKLTAAVATLAVATQVFTLFSGSSESRITPSAEAAMEQYGETPPSEAPIVETCPPGGEEGMFADGPFEATRQHNSPEELHRQPEETLASSQEAIEYLFGENGVACNSVNTLAVLSALRTDLMGGAHVGPAIGSNTNIDSLVNRLKKINKREEAAQIADGLNRDYSYSITRNNREIDGVWVRAEVNPDNIHRVRWVEHDVEWQAGEVFVFDPSAMAGLYMAEGGETVIVNPDQDIVLDPETGQLFARRGVGARIIEKEEQVEDEDQEGAENPGANNGGGGGSGNGAGEGPGHNGDTRGCDGTCGTGNSGGGTGGGGGCGGGCGTGGGGGGGGGGGTTPPVTQPPVTQPPVTQPPVTQPPVTQPPVTQPPVTQPPVPPTHPENPNGPPPGAGQWLFGGVGVGNILRKLRNRRTK